MGNISQMDNALGMVMDALDEQGVSDNTLLVLHIRQWSQWPAFGGTTGGLRGGKRSDHEGGIRVPGLASLAGPHCAPGTTSDVPVVGTDVFATVLDIVGIPLPTDRTIDGVSMVPAFEEQAARPQSATLFWRTHVSPPGDRVAMRIGDWKIVGDETMTKFQLFEIQKDWKEENDLAAKMPEKTEEMKETLFGRSGKDIEEEGPNEWWESETQKPARGSKLNY